MSFETSRCPRHPSQQIVGVCAVCLRERLVDLTYTNLNGYVDCTRSPSQHSPTNEKARSDSFGGVVDGDFSAGGKKISNAFDGRWSTAIPGNVSRSIRRSRSFSDSKSSVACVSEDAFLETKVSQVRTRKKPLWPFSNLDDGSRQKGNAARAEHVSNIGRKIYAHAGIGCKRNGDFISCSGARSKIVQTKATAKNEGLSQHEVHTDRLKSPSTYAASERSKSPSWLSSLFHRRSRKSPPKSREIVDVHSEWRDARSPIDVRRPPSHGRVRSSSGEGDQPLWEATRPYETAESYNVALAVNDASPFRSLHESDWEGKLDYSDVGIEQEYLSGYLSESTGDYGYDVAARPFIRLDVDGVALRATVEGALRQILAPSTSFHTGSVGSDNKPKKDLSPVTLETPPGTQESPFHDTEIEKSPIYQSAGRRWSSRWSGVWSGIGSEGSMWALNERTSEQQEQGEGREDEWEEEDDEEAATDDQTSTVSGTSSLWEGSQESFYQGSADGGLRKENGMWWNAAYQYGMLNGSKKGGGDGREKAKEEKRRGGGNNNVLPSASLESGGLLRFYLTPVRSGAKRGGKSRRQKRERRERTTKGSLFQLGTHHQHHQRVATY